MFLQVLSEILINVFKDQHQLQLMMSSLGGHDIEKSGTEKHNNNNNNNNNNKVRQLLSRAVTWEGHYKGAVQSLYNCHYH